MSRITSPSVCVVRYLWSIVCGLDDFRVLVRYLWSIVCGLDDFRVLVRYSWSIVCGLDDFRVCVICTFLSSAGEASGETPRVSAGDWAKTKDARACAVDSGSRV